MFKIFSSENLNLGSNKWFRTHIATPYLRSGIYVLAGVGYVATQIQAAFVTKVLEDIAHQKAQDFGENPQSVYEVLTRYSVQVVAAIFFVLILFAVVFLFLQWYCFLVKFSENKILISTGIFYRSRRVVQYSRIRSVTIAKPFLARIFGLSSVNIATADSSKNVKIDFLPSKTAKEIRKYLMSKTKIESVSETGLGSNNFYKTPLVAYFFSRILNAPFIIVLVILVSPIFFAFNQLWLATFSAMIAALPILFGLLSKVVRESTTRIVVDDGTLKLFGGIFDVSSESFPLGSVHAVRVSQPFLWRVFGWWQVKIVVLRGGRVDRFSHILLPVAKKNQVEAVMPLLLDSSFNNFSDILDNGGSKFFVDDLEELVVSSKKAFSFLGLSYANYCAGFSESVLVFRHGFFRRRISVVSVKKIQGVVVLQNFLAAKLGLVRVRVATVSGRFKISVGGLSTSLGLLFAKSIIDRSRK